jgi:phage-related minor tail protein
MAKEKINIVLQGINNTQKAFKDIKRNLDTLDKKTKGIQKSFSFVAKSAVASFTAVSVAVGVSTARIDRLVKTSEKLGVSAEFLQKFRFAAEQAGIRTETADMAVQRFTRRLAEADKGTGEAKDALNQLGIQLRDNEGTLRPVEEVLLDVADGIKNVTSESEKVRLAFKFFDSEGVALVGTMKGGSAVLKEFFNDAESLGAVLTTQSAKGVADFADEMTRLRTLVGGLAANFTASLAPALEEITKNFTAFIQEQVAAQGGFQQFGNFLANEFLGILQTIIAGFTTLANVTIDVLNTIRGAGLALGLIEESEAAKELRKELENLGTIQQNQLSRGSAFATAQLVLTEEEKKRREEILKLLDLEGNIQKLNTTDLISKLDEIRQNLKDNPINLFPDPTENGDGGEEKTETFGSFFKNATQALENFKKETVDQMMTKAFEDAFKSAEDALVSFLETGKLNFKDFVNQILVDFARIEIRKGLTNILGSVLEPKAIGGAVRAGQPYLVGEQGAELFVPSQSGTIKPNNQTANMMGGGANISFNIQATDATGIDELLASRKNQIVAMISQAMNQKGRAGLI